MPGSGLMGVVVFAAVSAAFVVVRLQRRRQVYYEVRAARDEAAA